jgi:hypothetical protein
MVICALGLLPARAAAAELKDVSWQYGDNNQLQYLLFFSSLPEYSYTYNDSLRELRLHLRDVPLPGAVNSDSFRAYPVKTFSISQEASSDGTSGLLLVYRFTVPVSINLSSSDRVVDLRLGYQETDKKYLPAWTKPVFWWGMGALAASAIAVGYITATVTAPDNTAAPEPGVEDILDAGWSLPSQW